MVAQNCTIDLLGLLEIAHCQQCVAKHKADFFAFRVHRKGHFQGLYRSREVPACEAALPQ
jgi:hypothetical protein